MFLVTLFSIIIEKNFLSSSKLYFTRTRTLALHQMQWGALEQQLYSAKGTSQMNVI